MARKSKAPVLQSAAHLVKHVEAGYEFTHPDFYVSIVASELGELNKLLAKLGYKALALRVNMISGRSFIEDQDTPGYLSPSRESYWSM